MPSAAKVSAQEIFEELRESILQGELVPGQHLPETTLAQRYDVSRGPVRDALRLLVDSGLAHLVPNAGVSVRAFTIAEAQALYELREGLEAQAARLAALHMDDEAGAQLEDMLIQHEAGISAHPDGAYLTKGQDTDFHVRIVTLAGNPLLHRLLTQELYPQLILLRQQHQNVQGRGHSAWVEHRRIFEALADRDPLVADLQMRRHIRNSWSSLSAQISETLSQG
ncbi:GntR family transcriptional regulator [Paracoccus haematequi]|uniref:GntR family transcriptional regulator n=1 Tax=Paracoccus haematequi TaxID=2491866 RepID=UPI000F7F5488|nr:GntR family transcriptional regulator [Paracoccus haematequi]